MPITDGFFFALSAIPNLSGGSIQGSIESTLSDIPSLLSQIPLPSNFVDPTNFISQIPLPSNFVDGSISTNEVFYPMPENPVSFPMLSDMEFSTPGQSEAKQDSSPLQQFISEIRNRDFAFQSKYKVTIPDVVSAGSIEGDSVNSRTLQLFCEAAELPGIFHETRPFHFYGPNFQRPTDVSYGDEIRMVFFVDQKFHVRKFFDSWLRMINNPINFTFNYPTQYLTSQIIIQQIKHRGEDLAGDDVGVYSIRLIDAFPKSVAPMILHYSSRDMHRLIVTFSYARWIPFYGDGIPDINFGPESNNEKQPGAPADPTRTTQTQDSGYGSFFNP